MSPRLSKRLDAFPGQCPSGGKWYACPKSSASNFVGCCTSDPCSSTAGCFQGNLRTVSFPPGFVGWNVSYPDLGCNVGSDFYKCNFNAHPFWGCCKTNPCSQGSLCPSGDLTPAFVDRNDKYGPYVGDTATPASSSPAGSSPTGSSSTNFPVVGSPTESKHSNNIAIIGGGIGAGLGLAALLAVLIFLLCRRRKRKEPNADSTPSWETPQMVKTDPYPRDPYANNPYSPNPGLPPYTSPDPNAYPPSPAMFSHPYEAEPLGIQELPASPGPTSLKPSSGYVPYSPHAATARGSVATSRMSELPAGTERVASGEQSPGPWRPTEADVDPGMHRGWVREQEQEQRYR